MKKIHGQILFFLSFIYLIAGSYIFLPSSFDTASAVGNLIGVSLLLYLAIKLINRRRSDEAKDRGYVALGVTAILWVSLVLYKEVSNHKNLSNYVNTIESGDISKLENTPESNFKVPGYSGNDTDGTQILINAVLVALKPYNSQIEKNQVELEKLELDEVLSANMFNNKSKIISGYQKLDKWAYFANEEARLINDAYKAQLAAIDKTSVSPAVKQGFLKGLNKSVNDTHNFHKQKTAATLNSIAIGRKILKLAEMNIGLVKVTPGGVLFPKEEDNHAYAQALLAIQKEASDEEKYANAIVNYQQAAINKMKNALSK